MAAPWAGGNNPTGGLLDCPSPKRKFVPRRRCVAYMRGTAASIWLLREFRRLPSKRLSYLAQGDGVRAERKREVRAMHRLAVRDQFGDSMVVRGEFANWI